MMCLGELRQHIKANYPSVPTHWQDGWLLHCLDETYTALYTCVDKAIDTDKQAAVLSGMAQMAAGVPLAYLTGEQAFYQHVFKVNEHTLIPRPDSELLLGLALDFAKAHAPTGRLLDLGTGSGCLAISLAKALLDSQVVAVDASDSALALARENAQRLEAPNCDFLLSDWYQHVTGVFDVIISNPPYIDAHDPHLAALVAEPMSALIADEGGMADIRRIVDGAGAHLKSGGLLVIEHGHTQGQQARELFLAAGFLDVRTVQDYGANERVTLGIWQKNEQ